VLLLLSCKEHARDEILAYTSLVRGLVSSIDIGLVSSEPYILHFTS
jgi:hypothetical protein